MNFMKKNLISIIVPYRRKKKFFQQTINSIKKQTYTNYELIIVYDDTKKFELNFVKKVIKNIARKKIIVNKINQGAGEARNKGIKYSSGEYICFCDVDDWWIKSKLKKQLIEIQKKNVNLVFSNLYIFNQKTKNKKLFFKGVMPNGKITQTLLDDYKLGILSVMISKKIFKKKIFDKRYNIIGDFDFFINLSLKENFYCIPEPLAYYRNHENNYSKKINIFINELNIWLKLNSSKFERLKYSLTNFKLWVYKIKVKKLIGWGL